MYYDPSLYRFDSLYWVFIISVKVNINHFRILHTSSQRLLKIKEKLWHLSNHFFKWKRVSKPIPTLTSTPNTNNDILRFHLFDHITFYTEMNDISFNSIIHNSSSTWIWIQTWHIRYKGNTKACYHSSWHSIWSKMNYYRYFLMHSFIHTFLSFTQSTKARKISEWYYTDSVSLECENGSCVEVNYVLTMFTHRNLYTHIHYSLHIFSTIKPTFYTLQETGNS